MGIHVIVLCTINLNRRPSLEEGMIDFMQIQTLSLLWMASQIQAPIVDWFSSRCCSSIVVLCGFFWLSPFYCWFGLSGWGVVFPLVFIGPVYGPFSSLAVGGPLEGWPSPGCSSMSSLNCGGTFPIPLSHYLYLLSLRNIYTCIFQQKKKISGNPVLGV